VPGVVLPSRMRRAWECRDGPQWGADSAGAAPGGIGDESERRVSRARDQRRHVLHLEEAVRGAWVERTAWVRQLREENGKLKQLVADLSLDRHILQEIMQKAMRPGQRRALGQRTQAAFALSGRRAAGLVKITRKTLRYWSAPRRAPYGNGCGSWQRELEPVS
jgi:hypothetical protein